MCHSSIEIIDGIYIVKELVYPRGVILSPMPWLRAGTQIDNQGASLTRTGSRKATVGGKVNNQSQIVFGAADNVVRSAPAPCQKPSSQIVFG